jgi:hypothetical protein
MILDLRFLPVVLFEQTISNRQPIERITCHSTRRFVELARTTVARSHSYVTPRFISEHSDFGLCWKGDPGRSGTGHMRFEKSIERSKVNV